MCVVGIVMIDRDPFELRFEVAFHLPHQLAHVVAKIEAVRGLAQSCLGVGSKCIACMPGSPLAHHSSREH